MDCPWPLCKESMTNYLNIAVEGCCHGELDIIYDTLRESERHGAKVDLLLICGDFQCVRNRADLQCLAVPQKYRKLNTFHQYVTGEKVAHVPTIFIGGNHEASNILQSLYYGGWVAPNIYFLGFGGVVWFGGVRIAGISGIFDKKHYRMGHFERPPYTPSSMRSVYHQRELEVFRLAMLSGNVDIFLSHDWPTSVWDYGDKVSLLRRKPYFREEMAANDMGSPPLMHLMRKMRPAMWFSAHLHVKFAAVVPHEAPPPPPPGAPPHRAAPAVTRFLALDKVLPGRDFLQILRIPRLGTAGEDLFVQHDAEWLAILRKTHSLLSNVEGHVPMPTTYDDVTPEDIADVCHRMGAAFGGMRVPDMQPEALPEMDGPGRMYWDGNRQTDEIIEALGLHHVWTRPAGAEDTSVSVPLGQGQPAPVRPPMMPPASWLADSPSYSTQEGLTDSDHAVNFIAGAVAFPTPQCTALQATDSNEIDIDDIVGPAKDFVGDSNEVNIDNIY